MMSLFLTNWRTAPRQTLQTDQRSLTLAPVPVTKSLNSSMIARIHNAKPGCRSCGR